MRDNCLPSIIIKYPARPLAYSRVTVSREKLRRARLQARPITRPLDADLQHLVTTLSQVILETLSKRRSLSQLCRWVDNTPLSAFRIWQNSFDWSNAKLASVHASTPSRNVIEASLRLATSQLSLAGTMRVEYRKNRWICTHFSLLTPTINRISHFAPAHGNS